MSAYTPQHMAPSDYLVVCGDGQPHAGGTFDTPMDAQRWIDTGLCCIGRHRICREGVLAEVGL